MENKTHQGYVLWFDQKKGFGFLKVNSNASEYVDKEIFFHFSEVRCNNNFKKVFPGEYVEFEVVNNENDENRPFNATNITGINGGLMLIDNPKYNYKIVEKRNSREENTDENV